MDLIHQFAKTRRKRNEIKGEFSGWRAIQNKTTNSYVIEITI